MSRYVYVSTGACGGKKRIPDSLELDLPGAVSSLPRVWGTKFWSSARAASNVDH